MRNFRRIIEKKIPAFVDSSFNEILKIFPWFKWIICIRLQPENRNYYGNIPKYSKKEKKSNIIICLPLFILITLSRSSFIFLSLYSNSIRYGDIDIFRIRSGQDSQKKELDYGSGSWVLESLKGFESRITTQMWICDPWILFYGSFETVKNWIENKISTQLTDVKKPVPLVISMALLIIFTSVF